MTNFISFILREKVVIVIVSKCHFLFTKAIQAWWAPYAVQFSQSPKILLQQTTRPSSWPLPLVKDPKIQRILDCGMNKYQKWVENPLKIMLSMTSKRNIRLKFVTSKLPSLKIKNVSNVINEDPRMWIWPLVHLYVPNVLECCKLIRFYNNHSLMLF